MNQQYIHLPDLLSSIILNHDHNTGLGLPEIIKMSKRHIRYGLKLADYKVAGSALLSTFKKRLGNESGDKLKASHCTCHSTFSEVIINEI